MGMTRSTRALCGLGLVLRLALIALALPWTHARWFVPFLGAVPAHFADPWGGFMAIGGDRVAFPYGLPYLIAYAPLTDLGGALAGLAGAHLGLGLTVLLWFLASFPAPPAGATGAAIEHSFAGMLGHGLGMITFLLACNIILLLAGNFMEPSSIVLIFAPILFPVAMKLGIDPVHFGILMVVNMEVGMCHPPVGLNLYVASGITKMGITELTVAVWPWLLSMLGFLVVVTYWPGLSLWLPRQLGML